MIMTLISLSLSPSLLRQKSIQEKCLAFDTTLPQNFPINEILLYRAPVAQLVEHRAVMREVASSTPAGPTLRVLK